MTKLLAMVALGLLAGAGLLGEKSDASQPTGEAAVVAQTPERGVYHLKRGGGSVSCIVARGADLSESLSELRVDPSCEDVMAGMATVRYWRETEDDTVVFSSDGNDALVTFAMADGVAYESFAPAAPLLSLAVSN